MTRIESINQSGANTPAPIPVETDQLLIAREPRSWVDRWADRISESFSPILIKEARQVLKSRQFLWTFFLMLAAVTVWTLVGWSILNVNSPDDVGSGLLYGYLLILGFPLGIVIPFSAFRSLAGEFENGTIQLISVTTMSSWQIVLGKLGSAALQIVAYLSVLAPCIAFTYLLRGVSVAQILFALSFCVVISLAFSCAGLFFACLARNKLLSTGFAVLFVLALGFAYFLWIIFAWAVATSEIDVAMLWLESGRFMSFGMFGLVASSGLLFLASAASQISFAADNRSTLPRAMMLVQQTVFLAWVVMIASYAIDVHMAPVLGWVYGHYWLIMGCLLIGESSDLSARVLRGMPRSILGRSMFSLLMPGPGRGLLFAISNAWVCQIVIFLVLLFSESLPMPEDDRFFMIGTRNALNVVDIPKAFRGGLIPTFYVTFYLCITYLIARLIASKSARSVTPLATLCLGAIVVVLSTLLPVIVQLNLYPRHLSDQYTPWQVTNWYWTTYESVEATWINASGWVNTFVFFALVPILLALYVASKELLYVWRPTPKLVVQDRKKSRRVRDIPAGESIEDIFNAPGASATPGPNGDSEK